MVYGLIVTQKKILDIEKKMYSRTISLDEFRSRWKTGERTHARLYKARIKLW